MKPAKSGLRGGALGVLSSAIFILLFGIALVAPEWTKAGVLLFRAALMLWVVTLLLGKLRYARQLPIALPLLTYLLLVTVSTIFSPEPALSWGRMRTIELFLLAFVAATSLVSRKQMRAIWVALLVSTVFAAGYTAWQFASGMGVSIALRPFPPKFAAADIHRDDVILAVNGHLVRDEKSWKQAVAAEHTPLLHIRIERGDLLGEADRYIERAALESSGVMADGAVKSTKPRRAEGFFGNYIPFAEMLMLVAAFTWGVMLTVASAPGKRRSLFLLLAAFLAIAAALLSTQTRAAACALLLAGVVSLWMLPGWRSRLAGTVAALLLVAVGLNWFRHQRGGDLQGDAGTQYRILMWEDGLRLAWQHPLTGIGMDTVEKHGGEFGIRAYQRYPNLKSHFHSTPIQIAAECGWLALAAWCWAMIVCFRTVLQLYRSALANDVLVKSSALGGLAMLVAFNALSLAHYITGDAEVMIVFWLLLGLVIAADASLGAKTDTTAVAA